MKLFLLLLFCLAGLAPAGGSLFQFKSMIKYMTGKSASSYISYGCHCGWGGSKQPVDTTDWCCHAHDCCYKRISSFRCSPKLVKYGYYFRGSRIICTSRNSCESQTCECDRRAAECFRRAAYNKKYKYYPNVLCRGRTPSC